ncbi:hypothetical protein IC229_30775 [Spirosoma sp. BT702]|uniref:Uncharacterized protein n=1 Tax=Spirosoma profusum TaxID=2771354 RepID=A0A927AV85_9BACT|nr:hypothetical protein [Spirosoma profusum]MBD2705050.1 hypothetical protein [Spirosoma profusum]
MNSIKLIVAVLATGLLFLFGILLYYRAWLKSKLEKFNQPQSAQEFNIFKPVKDVAIPKLGQQAFRLF